MHRSLYPDGVTVDQVALRRTELTKAQEILRNRIDWTCRGVFSGGVVTVNALDDTRIDIMQASGFAPNGEYVETDSPYYSIALADYTLGTVNYVCLVYTESNSYQQPHESDGYKYYTRADMAWRARVYSAAQYAALPSSDENLANDAQDRIIFFAKVTANGAGVSLTVSSIESPRTFNNIMYTVPRKCVVVLGVDILAASAGSPLGAGTLSYTHTPGTPPLYDFQWTTSNGPGAVVNVPVDGDYTLLDGAGESIKVKVALTVLPTFVVPTTLTETITVFNLYYQEMPRLSAEDHLHRNYIGTGVVSPQNPHGNSLDDFSGESFSLLDEHQDVLHCNGIWRGSSSSLFQITVLNNPGNDTFNLVPPAGSDLYYINGRKLNDIDQFLSIPIPPPAVQSTYFYEICVSDSATVECNQKAAYPAARTVTGTWIVDMSPNYPFGSAVLTCTTAGPFAPKIFTWDGGKAVTFTPLSDPSQAIRLYSADGEHWIDLWVNTNPSINPDETLPTGPGTVSDTITIFSSLTDGSNQFMQIGAVLYWYNAISLDWVLGYHPLAATRYAVDKRIWGTTGTENMATWALEDLAYLPNNELGRSGALLRRNGVYNEFQYTYGLSGFNFSVNGGSFYCRGQRLSVKSIQNLVAVPSAVQLVWVDMAGVYQVLNVTGTFGGDLQAAMRYVLGFTQNVPTVSSVYHYSDATDAPERGVLLYYLVTDATDITRIIDFTQNVNRVDDPWSVGSRLTTSMNAVHAQAAYDNFFTAFEYAKYSMYGTENKGAVTLTVIGTVEVDFKVTQPEYVNVRGTRGVSVPSKSIVRVAGTDIWGTWQLSAGCKISNLSVYNTSATLPAVALSHYTTVEECFFVSLGGASFRSASLTDLSSAGVVLRNNTSTGAPLLNSAFLPNGHVGWIITGNEVLAVPAGTTGAIELPNVEKLTISDNIISLPDSNDAVVTASGGINIVSNGFQCQDITIRDNHISVGNNAPAQANSVAGIYLHEVWFATVSGNTIKRSSGSATQIGVGIYVDSISQSSIVDNKIYFMGGGIYARGYSYDTSILGNKMQALFHSGIDVYVSSFPVLNSTYGLRIEGNNVYVMVKGTVGGLFPGADLIGIVASTDLSLAASALNGWSLSNNFVAALTSGSNVYGIVVDIDKGAGSMCQSIDINNNSVGTLSSTTGAIAGISISGTGSAHTHNVSLCGNHVIFTAATTSPLVTGIYSSAYLDRACIESNNVFLDSVDDTANGVALYVGKSSSPSRDPIDVVISHNVLRGLSSGAYLAGYPGSVVSGNTIYGKGSGLHVGGSPSNRTVVQGNRILVEAYIESPYAVDTGWPGAQCISADFGSSGIMVLDNSLYLRGVVRGPEVQDVPAGSSCIHLQDLGDVCIDGCILRSDAITVEGTDGTGASRGFLLFYSAGAAPAGRRSTLTIKNCVFDDRIEETGAARTPLYCLFIIPGSGFDHANGDQLSGTVSGNTFFTSNGEKVGPWTYSFNEEAVGLAAVPPALAPYVIYVSYLWGDEVANVATKIFFVSNAIHAYPTQGGPTGFGGCRAYVYMPMYDAVVGTLSGVCFFAHDVLCNFVTFNAYGLMTENQAWRGRN